MAKKQSIDWNGDVITITYGNGQKFVRDCTEYPASIYVSCHAARHGIGQKLGDAKSNGTAAEKYAEVVEIDASLLNGSWNRRGESGGLDAIMPEVFRVLDPAKVDTWMAKWAGCSEEQRAEIAAKPAVKAAIAKVKADRRLAKTETDESDPFDL